MITGIYLIRNEITNKQYIGKSNDIEKRWGQHRTELNCNRHHNYELQKDWNTYKEDSFSFLVLEECPKNITSSRERFWISTLKTNEIGYNDEKKQDSHIKRHNDIKNKLFDLCKTNSHEGELGFYYFSDVCKLFKMKRYQLIQLLDEKLYMDDFKKHGLYIMYNFDNDSEYVSFNRIEDDSFDKFKYYESLPKISKVA